MWNAECWQSAGNAELIDCIIMVLLKYISVLGCAVYLAIQDESHLLVQGDPGICEVHIDRTGLQDNR